MNAFVARFIDVIGQMPTTNLRIIVSIALAIQYVTAPMAFAAFGKTYTTDTDTGFFILAMMGLDVVQYVAKRKTQFNPSPQPPADAGGGDA